MPAKQDMLCGEIAVFANSSADYAVHTVELTTDWGGTFSKEKNVIAAHTCLHNQYAPGIRLCSYLMDHTSIEFATYNFERTLSCLGKTEINADESVSNIEYLNEKVSFYGSKHVNPHVIVDVEFSTGSHDKAPSLKIAVQRLKTQ
jgi:hypothetical protein